MPGGGKKAPPRRRGRGGRARGRGRATGGRAARGAAAEEALGAIEVEYEELPAITDVHEALKKNAALVHDYVKVPEAGFADLAEIRPVEGTNICTHFKLRRGDIDKGFAESDRIFEDTFTLP